LVCPCAYTLAEKRKAMTPKEKHAVNLAIIDAQVELDTLSKRAHLTQQERRRFDYLVSRVSSLKAGFGVDELNRIECNQRRKADGFTPVEFHDSDLSVEQRAFCAYLRGGERDPELRVLLENNPQLAAINTTGGALVPIEFENNVTEALAQTDNLLDEDAVTVIANPTLATRPLHLPGWDLSTISSVEVDENTTQEDGIAPSALGKLLGGAMHRVTLAASFEIEQDAYTSVMNLMARAYGVAFARGIGAAVAAKLVAGAANSGFRTANIGKLVLPDFTSIYFALNRVYRASPKCAWVMNDATYQLVRAAADNSGRPLLSVERDGEMLFGKPIRIAPNVPGVNASPLADGYIVFGDLSHLIVRLSAMTIQRTIESGATQGRVELGSALYTGRMRADSIVFDPSNGSSPPIIYARVKAS
jgi:HK97 family phage major capsid protein